MNIINPMAQGLYDKHGNILSQRLHKRFSENQFGMTNFHGDFLVDLVFPMNPTYASSFGKDTQLDTQLPCEEDHFVLRNMDYWRYPMAKLLIHTQEGDRSAVYFGEDFHHNLDLKFDSSTICGLLMHTILSFEYSWVHYKKGRHHTGHWISVLPANLFKEYKEYTTNPEDPKDLSIPDVTKVPSFLQLYDNYGFDVNDLKVKNIHARVRSCRAGVDLDDEPFVVVYILER